MISLELVQFINDSRQPGDAELRHDSFMTKVPKVLGEGGVQKFLDTYRHPQNGQLYPCYRFPKREACLMAMSYSYDLQARVYDRMTALEAQAAPAVPRSFVEAMRIALAQAEALEKAQAEVQAMKPAALVGERVAAHKHTLEQIVRTFPGVYTTRVKGALELMGYLYRTGSTGRFRAYRRHNHLFVENFSTEMGQAVIVPTLEGRALLCDL